MRATMPTACAALLLPLLAASCGADATSVMVEFDVVGSRAAEAERLDVLLRCEPADSHQERMTYDLDRLGQGLSPSLSIEPGDPACAIVLSAEVYGGDVAFPLAATRVEIAFGDGERRSVQATLDTDDCVDVDGDDVAGGRGGVEGCGDCDELNRNVFLGAAEQCNGVDDDCNGIVDDLDDYALGAACVGIEPPWTPDVGLCRYWRPQCQNGIVFCPTLPFDDDCDTRMDTNCDGTLTGCGCTTADLDSSLCPECHVAVCEGEDVVCQPDFGEGLPYGCCWDRDGFQGQWVCDLGVGEHGQLLCAAGWASSELCDDEWGADEDCDGSANADDSDCAASLDFACTDLVLPALAVGSGACGGGDEVTYILNRCGEAYIPSYGTLSSGMAYVELSYGPEYAIAYAGVANCCDCFAGIWDLGGVAVVEISAYDVFWNNIAFFSRGIIDLQIDVVRNGIDLGWTTISVPVVEDDPTRRETDTSCFASCSQVAAAGTE